MDKNVFIFHLHSDYSNCTTIIDSATKPKLYVDRAKELGMTALAFSEHGNVLNWYEKKQIIEKAGMKYVHGVEVYITEYIGINELGEIDRIRDNYHCILLAKNEKGFREINKLVSIANNRKDGHFYYVPRITMDEFLNISENIIVTSACFTKDMEVRVADGYKKISEVVPGDLVLNMFSDYEKVNFPTKRPYNGNGYKIRFIGNSDELICTEDHKFLTICANNKIPKWLEVKNFDNRPNMSNKTVCLFPVKERYFQKNIISREEWNNSLTPLTDRAKYKMPDEILITPEFMRFVGVFIGDGSISTYNIKRICITCNGEEFDYLYNSCFKMVEEQLRIKFSITKRPSHNRVDISCSSIDFVNLFYYLFGDTKAATKHIPQRLRNISKELTEELLFGYMISDGSFGVNTYRKYSNGKMVCASISKRLIKDIKEEMETIGIPLNEYSSKERTDLKGVHHCKSWYGVATGKVFLNLDKRKEYSHYDVVEIFDSLIMDNKSRYIEYAGTKYKKVYIKKCEKIDIHEDVYCLNNNTHSFVCGGVIVHNCLGGVLWSGNEYTKRKYINYLIKNRDRCFLEIQHHNVPEQIEYNKQLYELSKKYALKLVAGTDTHSLNNELAEAREVLQKSKNIRFENEDGWDLTFKSYDELVESYRIQNSLPEEVFIEAIDNTNLIADMIEEYHFDGTPKYPKLYDNSSEIFRDMVYDAIDTHPDALKNHTREEIVARVEEELPVYESTKTVDFMLFQKFVRDTEHSMGIYTGPGRGSVSASMIAYLLGITDVDSMRFGLELFRFLNPSRVTNCDIDSDYYDPDRVKMRNFLLTYPKIRSAEIAAFGTIALRGAIDDVGRAFGIPLQEVKEIKSRIIVDENGFEDFNPNDKQKYPELVHFVNILQGVITSVGTHPAGVLCATRNIDEEIGLFSLSTTEHPVSCLDMHWLDTGEMSWTKLDMLG